MVLGRRLQQGWKRLKNLPVSLRVTLWYTLFLSIILVLFTGVILKMGVDYEKRAAGRSLIKAVEKAGDRYTGKKGKFRSFDDNVYLSLQTHRGELLEGAEPEEAPRGMQPVFGRGPQRWSSREFPIIISICPAAG